VRPGHAVPEFIWGISIYCIKLHYGHKPAKIRGLLHPPTSSSIARAPSSPRIRICEQQSAKTKWRRRPAAAAPPRRLEQVALRPKDYNDEDYNTEKEIIDITICGEGHQFDQTCRYLEGLKE
jgi:hypothetical protein